MVTSAHRNVVVTRRHAHCYSVIYSIDIPKWASHPKTSASPLMYPYRNKLLTTTGPIIPSVNEPEI